MKYAIISDIHANMEALGVAIESARNRGVDEFLCLGDVVGYGANPEECVREIRGICTTVLMGNHDSAVIGETSTEMFTERARKSTDWTVAQLSEESLEYLRQRPMSWTAGKALAVHASPVEPPEWHYILNRNSADDAFQRFSQGVCFVGHSHQPVLYRHTGGRGEAPPEEPITLEKDTKYIINVGSVGQPRDGDSRLAYGIYDSEQSTFELCREVYDIAAAADKIISAGLPEELGRRLYIGM